MSKISETASRTQIKSILKPYTSAIQKYTQGYASSLESFPVPFPRVCSPTMVSIDVRTRGVVSTIVVFCAGRLDRMKAVNVKPVAMAPRMTLTQVAITANLTGCIVQYFPISSSPVANGRRRLMVTCGLRCTAITVAIITVIKVAFVVIIKGKNCHNRLRVENRTSCFARGGQLGKRQSLSRRMNGANIMTRSNALRTRIPIITDCMSDMLTRI